MNKKAFIFIPTIGVVIAIICGLIFGVPLMAWLLSLFVWKLVGVVIVIMAGIAILKGGNSPLIWVLLIAGVAMIFWNSAYDLIREQSFSIAARLR